MGLYDPFVVATVTPQPSEYGYLVNPPIALPAVAEDIHEQDNGNIDDGVYRDHIGEIWGADAPKLDGVSLDSGRNTGIVFTQVGTGPTIKDDWLDPLYSAYGLLIPDATAGADAFTVKQQTADTGLRHERIVIRRGVPPASSNPTAATCYTYLEFMADSDGLNYRLALEYSMPVRLQISTDGGATWSDVKQARKLPVTQDFFHLNNDCLMVTTFHDVAKGVFAVQLANGITLMHKPSGGLTGAQGKLLLTGKNGWHTFTMFYNYHRPLTVSNTVKAGLHSNASMAYLVGNALTSDAQTVSTSIVDDGAGTFTWEATVSKTDDSGGGLGSSDPPRFTDGTMIIPAYWTNAVPGGVNPIGSVNLKVMRVDETEVWDDTARVGHTSAVVYVNNYSGQYNGAVGKLACRIQASIDGGATLWTRLTGVSGGGEEGMTFDNPMAGIDVLRVPVADGSDVMGNGLPPVTLGFEHQFDGWPLLNVVRYLCEKGNIHPSRLVLLPDALTTGGDVAPSDGSGSVSGGIYYPPGAPTVLPGTNGHAPYGPADSVCPYPILGRGVGDNPRYVFGREMTPWQVLQKLVQDESLEYIDPDTGLITYLPYMMYFDKESYFHFEPYHPALLPVVCGFSSNAPLAASLYPALTWYPLEGFTQANSVSQMRSELTFQGLDALSNELLQSHLDMPPAVKEAIGHYSNWAEGSGRWGDQGTLNSLILTAGGQASLPLRTGVGVIPFVPALHAGQRVAIIHHSLGPDPVDFYINRLTSSYGHTSLDGSSGLQVNTSMFTCRAVVNF